MLYLFHTNSAIKYIYPNKILVLRLLTCLALQGTNFHSPCLKFKRESSSVSSIFIQTQIVNRTYQYFHLEKLYIKLNKKASDPNKRSKLCRPYSQPDNPPQTNSISNLNSQPHFLCFSDLFCILSDYLHPVIWLEQVLFHMQLLFVICKFASFEPKINKCHTYNALHTYITSICGPNIQWTIGFYPCQQMGLKIYL